MIDMVDIKNKFAIGKSVSHAVNHAMSPMLAWAYHSFSGKTDFQYWLLH